MCYKASLHWENISAWQNNQRREEDVSALTRFLLSEQIYSKSLSWETKISIPNIVQNW